MSNKNLVVIESGISGGSLSPIVLSAQKNFRSFSDTHTLQYCKDNNQDKINSFSMEDMTFIKYEKLFYKSLNNLEIKRYEKIFYIAHSFQSLVFLYIYKNMKKELKDKFYIIFWDPSTKENILEALNKYFYKTKSIYHEKLKQEESSVLFSESIKKEIESLNVKNIFENVSNKSLLITAEKAGDQIGGIYSSYNKNVQYFCIKNSGHMFGATKCRRELLKITKNFMKDPER